MQSYVQTRILGLTGASGVAGVQLIQPLWNDYGTLSRVHLEGGAYPSVIVKHIKIPDDVAHPRGFGGSISRERKIRSYQVETHWYQDQNKGIPIDSPTPRCLDAFADGGELFLLLEDLGNRGFKHVLWDADWDDIGVAIRWLAHFHAATLGNEGEGLWPSGTYWHLQTRPDELANIKGTRLHTFASLLDARLRCGLFPSLVHGDAKVANFLFNDDGSQVAAVDFQYVGRGAAMKDVAYFVGSCLSGPECERRESELLDVYFNELRAVLPVDVHAEALEAEWRELYPIAWADFQRFMLGWSPGHKKLTDYSDATTERALEAMTDELMCAAREACLTAGRFIQESRGKTLEVGSKGFASPATDVVTEIDLKAQAIILERLAPTIARYDLGMLAEEGEHDDSRLGKHAFWTIDPLDGTQYFIEGKSGYATSIALVSQAGKTILGVVYDPVTDSLFEAVKGRGVTLNGEPLVAPTGAEGASKTIWFADRSLRKHPKFAEYQAQFELRFIGGAVMNGLGLLTTPHSVYIKEPKESLGGCAIWDLAAVSLMLEEMGGSARTYGGERLHLNRAESVYFNDVGLALSSPGAGARAVLARIEGLGSLRP